MNLKAYYNPQSTHAIFFIKHTSSLGREEASSSFNIYLPLFVFTNRQREEIKTRYCFDYIRIKAVVAERKKFKNQI